MCPNQDSNGHQRMLLLSQGVVPLGHNNTATEDNLTFPTASIIFYNLLSDIRDIERSFTRYQIVKNYLVYNNYWESWLFPRIRIKKIFVDRLAMRFQFIGRKYWIRLKMACITNTRVQPRTRVPICRHVRAHMVASKGQVRAPTLAKGPSV